MKLIDLFNSENANGEIYRKFSPKKDSSNKNEEPFLTVLPDTDTGDIASDEQLVPDTVSVSRDRIRIKGFQSSYRGERFLDRQKTLQQGNTWAQTRNYRNENVIEHTDPVTHNPRHGFDFSLQSLKSKDILLGYQNDGKLQGETSDFLLSSTGPVFVRLNTRGGMLNQRLSLVDIVSGNVRGRISNKINNWLQPINDFVSSTRARTSDNTINDRPEIEFQYLQQVYDANKGVASGTDSHTFGHIYFPVGSPIGTYQENFTDAQGFKGYQALGTNPINRQTTVRTLFRRLESKVSRFLDNALDRIGLGEGSILRDFLPRANDINLVRNLRRLAGDIDDVVNNIRNFRNRFSLESTNLVPANLREKYDQSPELEKLEIVYADANKVLDEYKQQVANYLGTGKMLSIGGGVADGKLLHPINSVDVDENGYPDSPYLKSGYTDLIQRSRTIFKKDIPEKYDVDSIDVIFQIKDTGETEQDDEVRFRAFINDITETVAPSYNENKYIGRYETFYTYNKVVRDVGFSLTLHAFSKEELYHINGKMSYLTSLAYPTNTNDYLTPTICKFTIGDVYHKQPCILMGLTHTIEDDTSWDIDNKLPMTITSTVNVRLLDKQLYGPNATGIYFPSIGTITGVSSVLDKAVSKLPAALLGK